MISECSWTIITKYTTHCKPFLGQNNNILDKIEPLVITKSLGLLQMRATTPEGENEVAIIFRQMFNCVPVTAKHLTLCVPVIQDIFMFTFVHLISKWSIVSCLSIYLAQIGTHVTALNLDPIPNSLTVLFRYKSLSLSGRQGRLFETVTRIGFHWC